jgi:hypothetical protein
MSKKTHAMSRYTLPQEPKKPEHSFGINGYYCNYGELRTYSNRTQGENRVALLKSLGFKCYLSFKWPFVIIQDNQ